MPINSSSIPSLRIARDLRRRRRAEGGGIAYDPMSGLQIGGESADEPSPEPQSEFSRTISRLTGTQFGESRSQSWPEKMVRSGVTLAGDVLYGRQNVVPPGLRREDFTDIPAPSEPTEDSTWLGRKLNLPPVSAQPNDPMMERAQDMAGLAGGQTLLTGAREAAPAASRALVAAADSQATGAPLAALEHAPKFYSGLERAVEGVQQPAMTGQQWLGTLTNRGVKGEEMQWSGLGDYLAAKADQPVSKAEVAEHLGSNQVKIGEVEKGAAKPWDQLTGDQQWKLVDRWGVAPQRAREMYEEYRATGEDVGDFGGASAATRYQSYQLPGGENYREKLFMMPTPNDRYIAATDAMRAKYGDMPLGKMPMTGAERAAIDKHIEAYGDTGGTYKSGHWDEPNVLAHRRTNERTYDLPFTPEEAAAAEAHRGAQSQIEALRQQQHEIARQINEAAGPLNAARSDELMAKARAKKITAGEYNRALEQGFNHPELQPLQDKLQTLRAQEDQIRKALGPEPKPKQGRALHIEEIQSDWHQAGRKSGYAISGDTTGWTAEPIGKAGDMWRVRKPDGREITASGQTAEAAIKDAAMPDGGVPDAPFKKNWHELVLKDAIRDAAEKGMDRISWTPGEAQAARYDLSKQIDKLFYKPEDGYLKGFKDGKSVVHKMGVAPEELPSLVGKEAAQKLLDTKPEIHKFYERYDSSNQPSAVHALEGQDLKVGGEGMRGFYDKIIPDAMNKIGKPHGVKVERGETVGSGNVGDLEGSVNSVPPSHIYRVTPRLQEQFPTIADFVDYYNDLVTAKRADLIAEAKKQATGTTPIHYMDIPQSLKDQALKKGFSLFEDSASAGAPVAANEDHLNRDAAAVRDALAISQQKPKRKKVAIQPSMERKHGGGANAALKVARDIRRAKGGKVHVGPIVGDTGGRADKVPMEVPDGSYILTADLVSGLGEGNTLAGFEKLKKMFPKSTAAYKAAKANQPKKRASGGRVPIMAAHGEYSICPEDIIDRFGDLDHGHKVLDHWQTSERKKLIETLSKLAPPAQD